MGGARLVRHLAEAPKSCQHSPRTDDHILGEPGPESIDKVRVGWMQYLAERRWILPLAHRTCGP